MESCIPCVRLYGLPHGFKEVVNDQVNDLIRHFRIEEDIELRLYPKLLRIFIVDDDEGIRDSLKAIIESAGIHHEQITMAHTGHTALEILGYNNVDLLFIDMKLPDGLSGIDILKFAKHKNPDSACYIITGAATLGELEEAAILGAIEVIRKPFRPEQIIELIEERVKIGRKHQV